MSTETHGIPDDYIRQNFESGEPWSVTIARAINDAVLAERERCARVMEDDAEWTFIGTREGVAIFQDIRDLAVDAIRNPETKG